MAAPSPPSSGKKPAFDLLFDVRRLLEDAYMTFFKAEEKLDLAESLLRGSSDEAMAGQRHLVIQITAEEASINGSHIPLSPAQLKLLSLLKDSPGMLDREELRRLMSLDSHGLAVLLHKLKARLRDAGFTEVIIHENDAYRLRESRLVSEE